MSRSEAEAFVLEIIETSAVGFRGVLGIPTWANDLLARALRIVEYSIDLSDPEWRVYIAFLEKYSDPTMEETISGLKTMAYVAAQEAKSQGNVTRDDPPANESLEDRLARQDAIVEARSEQEAKATACVEALLHEHEAALVQYLRKEDEARRRAEHDAEERRRMVLKSRPAPAPRPQEFGVSHAGAEALVCAWMRHLGWLSAEVTRLSADGGIDVESDTHIAQVKNYTGAVGVEVVRELLGVASASRRLPLIFTSGTYTKEAKLLAEVMQVPLLRYDAERGTLAGINGVAQQLVELGFTESKAEAQA